MAEYVGSAMYLAWVYSSGTMNLDADSRSFGWAPSLNFIDATTGKDTFEVLLASYGVGQDITVPILAQVGSGVYYSTALAQSLQGSLIYGPEGSATGKAKFTIPALSQGVQWSSPYNDVTEMTAQFRQNAAYTAGTF